jgi:ATP phosphoribosyltransferase regulatory subunit
VLTSGYAEGRRAAGRGELLRLFTADQLARRLPGGIRPALTPGYLPAPCFPRHPPGALDLTARLPAAGAAPRGAVAALERAGYQELIPPSFEYEEGFLRAGGPGVAARLVRFPDRDGRILALRYDFTSSLARVASTTFAGAALPLRLAYSGKVFRQDPERGGRPRETLQVGAELLGAAGLAADVEIVRLTLALVRETGLPDYQLNLGHAGVLAPGLATLAEPLRAEVRRWIDRKDQQPLPRPGRGRRRRTDPRRVAFVIGRREALEAARARPAAARDAFRHLLEIDGGAHRMNGRTWCTTWARCGTRLTPGFTEVYVAGAAGGVRAAATTSHGADSGGRCRCGVLARPRHPRRSAAVSRLRIALAKGRLYEPSVERFRLAGAAPVPDAGRRLLVPSADPAIEFLVVKPADVPVYVESGAADLGVTGTDVLRESGADVLEPLELGFGLCRLVVASPAETGYPVLPGGITARVATIPASPTPTSRWAGRWTSSR